MKSSFYNEKWSEIKKSRSINELKSLSRQIAYSFLDFYLKDCHYESEYIDLLCEMTTFSDDPHLNNPGAEALFGIIVESLCDDFEELQTTTYNMVMTQVISFCRNLQSGTKLDTRLKDFNIFSQKDLLNRIEKIRNTGNLLPESKTIKKIILLSRVTIGADVAITSVIVQRLTKHFSKAEIIIIGSGKLKEIYEGNQEIRIKEVPYARRGGLVPRLSSWHLVLDIIQDETSALSPENFILIDPDSRLSQLGIMPYVSPENYFFFDSRSHSVLNNKLSMVELVNVWLDKITGKRDFAYPEVWAKKDDLEQAKKFCSVLKNNGAKNIIVINFGVGGNERKKVGKDLEAKLLLTLLQEPDTVILLDKGFGSKELKNTYFLLKSVENHEYSTFHASIEQFGTNNIKHGVIGVECRIGQIAALIANSDEFIGYDSACQHIAAALNIPCLTIFAGSNNMRFIRRWSAYGKKSSHIVHVDTLTNPAKIDTNGLITRIKHARQYARIWESGNRKELSVRKKL